MRRAAKCGSQSEATSAATSVEEPCSSRCVNRFIQSTMFVPSSGASCRHLYSQYLTAQVFSSDGRKIQTTKSSFYHYLRSLKWLPAYRPLEGDQVESSFVLPSSVYLSSRDVHGLLGNHVCYVDISRGQFSQDLGNSSAVLRVSASWSRCTIQSFSSSSKIVLVHSPTSTLILHVCSVHLRT